MKLTKAQTAVLNDLRTMPARCRHQGRAGAPVRIEYTQHFDYRTLAALIDRGLVIVGEFGMTTKQGA